jgi:hypothetical protein
MRDGLLFLHIVGVAGWLGGAAYAFYTYSALAPMEPAAAGPALQRLKKVEDRFFGPARGLVLLSGVGLVLTSEAFGWSDAFVLIGLGAFLISAIIGATVGKEAASAWSRRPARGPTSGRRSSRGGGGRPGISSSSPWSSGR